MHRVVGEIIEENEWRDGEFAKFKINALDEDETLWCRMCIPMVYAHWEGFVVSSLKILLDYLNRLELSANEMPVKLIVVGLGDSFKSLSGKQSFEQRVVFTDKFKTILQQTIKFKKKINTKSNLTGDVLRDLCEMFSFNYDNFEGCIVDINRLVNIRNSIAHGENSIIPDINNITKYIESVNYAMDTLLSEIDIFLTNKTYLINEVSNQGISINRPPT